MGNHPSPASASEFFMQYEDVFRQNVECEFSPCDISLNFTATVTTVYATTADPVASLQRTYQTGLKHVPVDMFGRHLY